MSVAKCGDRGPRISPRSSGLRLLVALEVVALKIELQRVGFDAVPAGGKEQHQALFLNATDRDGVVVAGSETRILRPFDVAETHALDRRLAAREALALRHDQVGPVARNRGTVAQRNSGRAGSDCENGCDGGAEREVSVRHRKTLIRRVRPATVCRAG